MHISASAPVAMHPEEVPEEIIARERAIVEERAKDVAKPEAMIEGSLKKFVNEMCLYQQAFIKDPSTKISKLLADNEAEVYSFHRLEVGEGIEVEEVDFAASHGAGKRRQLRRTNLV